MIREIMEEYTEIIVFAVIGIVVTVVGGVITVYGAHEQARVYNQIHGTSFTYIDFLWAANQINNGTQTINIK